MRASAPRFQDLTISSSMKHRAQPLGQQNLVRSVCVVDEREQGRFYIKTVRSNISREEVMERSKIMCNNCKAKNYCSRQEGTAPSSGSVLNKNTVKVYSQTENRSGGSYHFKKDPTGNPNTIPPSCNSSSQRSSNSRAIFLYPKPQGDFDIRKKSCLFPRFRMLKVFPFC